MGVPERDAVCGGRVNACVHTGYCRVLARSRDGGRCWGAGGRDVTNGIILGGWEGEMAIFEGRCVSFVGSDEIFLNGCWCHYAVGGGIPGKAVVAARYVELWTNCRYEVLL
jgi:hypothetical protein